MKIRMIDADSKEVFGNLVLKKLSAWHKLQGHEVDLQIGIPDTAPLEEYDKTYISVVFFQNKEKALNYASQVKNIHIGGSGFDYNVRLDHDIEHIMPDYDLYGYDISIGFTSRGCIRNCKWCIVHEKEGMIHDHAPIEEFLDPRHNKVILIDNNFQSSPKWRENLQFLIDHKIKVNFNQGLDARLVTEEFAQMLAESKCYDWKFNTR